MKNLGDLAADNARLSAQIDPVVKQALYNAATKLLIDPIARVTPVWTGFLRSRWHVVPITGGWSIRNNTYYFYIVDERVHFTREIVAAVPSAIKQELDMIKVDNTGPRPGLKYEGSSLGRMPTALEFAVGGRVGIQPRAGLLKLGGGIGLGQQGLISIRFK